MQERAPHVTCQGVRLSSFRISALAATALLAQPSIASANAGTPLMWATTFHLLIGNALIGLFEGALLARVFGFPRRSSVAWLIIANCLSCFAGVAGVERVYDLAQEQIFAGPPIFKVHKSLVAVAFSTFIGSVLIEWPFCYLAARRVAGAFRRSWLATLTAQTASYAVLVPLYSACSSVSLLTQTERRQDLGFVKSLDAKAYFIHPSDGAVWRIGLNGSAPERLFDAGLTDRNDRLFAKPSDRSSRVDLWAVTDVGAQKRRMLAPGFAAVARPLPRGDQTGEPGTWSNFEYFPSEEPANDFREPNSREWRATAGFWAAEGLVIRQHENIRYRLSLENPLTGLSEWTVRNVILLPGDQVVFQAADQILILDMHTRELGFLTMGRGPVVAFPSSTVSGT